jgi:hypothetical protein
MNIVNSETPIMIEAKTCGCNKKRNVSYKLIDSLHSLYVDKREMILSQIQACEELLKYTKDETDLTIIKKEISELKFALDLIHY